jgi:hypothetical protein
MAKNTSTRFKEEYHGKVTPQDVIEIPAPPTELPLAVQEKWKETYEVAFKEAEIDWPHDDAKHRHYALHAANRTLRTPDLTSYDQTIALEEWHFVLRAPSDDGKTLRVVTRHAKKYTFPIPEKA